MEVHYLNSTFFETIKKPLIYGGNSHWSESLVLIKLNNRSLLRFMSIIAFKFSDDIFDLLSFTVSPADNVLSTSAADAGTKNIAHANFERRGMPSL